MHKPAVLKHRQYRLLFVGQAVSAFGDSLVPVALAFAVIDLTGSASDLGFVLAAGLVPRTLLLLVGGVWADRLPRQRIMLAADVLRGATQALAAALLLAGEAHVWQLLILSALFGVGDAFFVPASTGLVPQTVPARELQAANALRSLSSHVAWTVGPAIAGGIVATAGAGWAFAIDAGTFAVSAIFLAAMRVPTTVVATRARNFVRELREGWAELRSRTWLWVSVLEFSLWNMAIAFVWVLGPLVAARSLRGASSWGLILAFGGIGSILGALGALRLRPRRPLLFLNLGCAVACLLPFSLLGPQSTPVIALAAIVCLGAMAFANAVWEATLQRQVPQEALSRVSSYDWLGSTVAIPIGMAIAGPLSNAIGIDATLVVAGSVLAVSALVTAAVPSVRRLERDTPRLTPAASPAGLPRTEEAGASR